MTKTAAAVAFVGGVLLSRPATSAAQTAKRTPVLTTPHFAIYSDLDTNLNAALVAAGLARRGKKPQLFHAGAERPALRSWRCRYGRLGTVSSTTT